MSDPKPGERFLDTLDTPPREVTYLGDNGQGPWWRFGPGEWDVFYCDWLDYYLWGRFKRV